MVLVPERLEGGPVSSRVSAFPDVFSMAEGGPKCHFMHVKVLARHTCEFIRVNSVLYNNSFNDLHNQHTTHTAVLCTGLLLQTDTADGHNSKTHLLG